MFVEYWISKGYDSDELVALGKKKSMRFLIEIANSWPEIDKDILVIHIAAFVQQLKKAA